MFVRCSCYVDGIINIDGVVVMIDVGCCWYSHCCSSKAIIYKMKNIIKQQKSCLMICTDVEMDYKRWTEWYWEWSWLVWVVCLDLIPLPSSRHHLKPHSLPFWWWWKCSEGFLMDSRFQSKEARIFDFQPRKFFTVSFMVAW